MPHPTQRNRSRLIGALDELNGLARMPRGKVKKGFWKIKQLLYDIRENTLMRYLSTAEYVVLGAIMARTLPFGKFAEVITLREFVHGVRERETGELSSLDTRDGDDFEFVRHVFSGCGLSENTVIEALKGLRDKGLISVYPIPRAHLPGNRWPRAYMPCTIYHLSLLVICIDASERLFGDGSVDGLFGRLLVTGQNEEISDPRLDPLGTVDEGRLPSGRQVDQRNLERTRDELAVRERRELRARDGE
jgi:hypothetical protein